MPVCESLIYIITVFPSLTRNIYERGHRFKLTDIAKVFTEVVQN